MWLKLVATDVLINDLSLDQCHGDHCDSKIRIDQTGSDFYNQLLAPITVIGFNPHDTWFKLELNIKKPCRNLRLVNWIFFINSINCNINF